MDDLKQIFIIDTNTKLQKTLLTQASRSGLSVGHVRFPSASALKKYPATDVTSGIVTGSSPGPALPRLFIYSACA